LHLRRERTSENYQIHWFEEPVPPESWKALKQVKEQVRTSICAGERLHTRWEFVPIFENGLADFVMPDVTWTGGISELKKIATMAEAYYVPISPHDASGPINVVAGAQVMMTVPNFYKLECHRYHFSGYDLLVDEPLDVREGFLHLTGRPGLGVNLVPEVLNEYEVVAEEQRCVDVVGLYHRLLLLSQLSRRSPQRGRARSPLERVGAGQARRAALSRPSPAARAAVGL
jgi:L-alanine-DL-glutamate epimerase-like enolase superfamily enzyme